ncbi:hypothetical protein ScPMuIL_004877 [Solemya velum]
MLIPVSRCLRTVKALEYAKQMKANKQNEVTKRAVIASVNTRSLTNKWSDLSSKLFWEKRYANSMHADFDWLVDGDTIVSHIWQEIQSMKHISKSHLDILDLGCGFSNVSKRLLQLSDEPIHYVCLDFASEALAFQKQSLTSLGLGCNHRNSFGSFIVGDCRHLPFKKNTFDVVLDKGTTDSVMKHKTDGLKFAESTVIEGLRALKHSGILVQITDEEPDCRSLFLESVFRNNGMQFDIKYRFVCDDFGIEKNIFFIRNKKPS